MELFSSDQVGVLKRVFKVFSGLGALFPEIVYAAAVRGWGETAQGWMGPVDIVMDFMVNACIVVGCTFLFATFIKWRQHKMNPLHVPISTVIFLLILSILLLCLPLAPILLNYLEHAGS